jgi:hypothetical protein
MTVFGAMTRRWGGFEGENDQRGVNRILAVLDYRETPLGPNGPVRFNRQRGIHRGQGSYVLAVMAPSDRPQS